MVRRPNQGSGQSISKAQVRFAKARAAANGCPRSRLWQEAMEDYKDARARYQ